MITPPIAPDAPPRGPILDPDPTAAPAVSPREPAGDEIHDSHERFRLLVDSVRDYAIYMLDPDGRVLSWNAGAARIKGYTSDEILGRHFSVFYPQDAIDRGWPAEELRLASEHGRFEDEGWRLRKDGSRLWANVVITALRDPSGRLQGFAKVTRDLTERKRHEQALTAKNAELERANRAKDHFLATMSHELRTPLNAIIGFTGTLLMRLPGPLTTDQEKQLRTVQTSARHLLSLINDLLDLAKIESGKLELRSERVDGHALVQEVITALRPAAAAKQLYLAVTLPGGPFELDVDRRALNQILLNLVTNAIRFTESGGVTLRVGPREQDGRLEFAVADTGIGIHPDEQAQLFQAFAQLGPAGKHRDQGTGLGLHLSARLAQLLGGQITLQSEPGRGSTFSLILGR